MSYLVTIKNLDKENAEDVTVEMDVHSVVPLLGYIIKRATTAAKTVVEEAPARATRVPKKNADTTPAASAPRKGRGLSDTQTKIIEDLIIEGKMKPAEIAEQAEVKPPVVYVIKMRLKKEGRI